MPVYGPSTAVSSSARTATGTSSAVALASDTQTLSLLIACTAVSGTTPTLDMTVEWSNDGTNWAVGDTADSFAQITAAKTTVKTFTRKAAQYRLRWTIGGTTPSFTFSVTATELS